LWVSACAARDLASKSVRKEKTMLFPARYR
jgi:hypothetical protein